jgi:aspartate/methionine/tyrosine aminotransferase
MRFPSERMKGVEKTLIRRVFDEADASCINLGLGELAFPTPRAILDRVGRDIGTWPLGYTTNAGLPELRGLIAARSGPGVTAEQVCVTIGAEEAIFAVLLILVNPGDEVLVPDPGFPAYATIVRLAGGSPVAYPLRPEERFAIRAENVAPRVTSRTRLIIVKSPHNPTGAVASEAELRALADLCRAEDLTAISDEVYREIVYDGPAGSLSRYHDRTVVVDSLSKAYSMTGWRLGWCVAPPELARLVVTFNQLAISCPPAVCQRAALLALGGVADEEKAANLRELGARRALAARRLEEETGFPVVLPRGAFYLYPDISSKLGPGRTSLDVALDLIKREKVITIPGLAFGRGTEGFLRVSFAAEPAAIEEGIRRLGRFFGRA